MIKQIAASLAILTFTGCAALGNTAPIDVNKGSKTQQSKLYAPIIASMTSNPTNTTTGQPITFEVKATDPNGQQMQYSWSTPQGALSASAGQLVSWTPPSAEGIYPIQVTITNLEGLSTSGSLNVIVKADGKVAVGAPTATASAE